MQSAESSSLTSVLVAEDHVMFREVLCKICRQIPSCLVVAETASGTAAIDFIKELRPNLVVLDLSLLDVDGFMVIQTITEAAINVRFLVVSAYCDKFTVYRLSHVQIHGFVDKNTNTLESLGAAVQALKCGNTYFSPSFVATQRALWSDKTSFWRILSTTELTLTALIGLSLDDSEIGEKMKISRRTAQTHRSNIMRKLGIKSTPKLIAFAISNGFCNPLRF